MSERENLIDEMKIAYDENGIPYMLEATGNEACHINELLQAEIEGRLIETPCRVGDIVYLFYPVRKGIYEAVVDEISLSKKSNFIVTRDLYFNRRQSVFFEQFGKTVFLSREEAEQKLKAMFSTRMLGKWEGGEQE